MLANGKFAADW